MVHLLPNLTQLTQGKGRDGLRSSFHGGMVRYITEDQPAPDGSSSYQSSQGPLGALRPQSRYAGSFQSLQICRSSWIMPPCGLGLCNRSISAPTILHIYCESTISSCCLSNSVYLPYDPYPSVPASTSDSGSQRITPGAQTSNQILWRLEAVCHGHIGQARRLEWNGRLKLMRAPRLRPATSDPYGR